jgi:hypothetical protein
MAEIVERAVRDLIPYARNPRKNEAVVDQMAASIRVSFTKIPPGLKGSTFQAFEADAFVCDFNNFSSRSAGERSRDP